MVKASASASAVTTASIRASLAAGVAAYLKLPPGVTVNTAVTGEYIETLSDQKKSA